MTEITIRVAEGVVPGIVESRKPGPVDLAISFRVLVDCHEHPGPGLLDDQESLLAGSEPVTFLVDDISFYSRHWKRGRAGLQRDKAETRARRDHNPASLSLPPSINNGTTALSYHVKIPLPGSGIDRFADRSQQTQAVKIVLLGEIVSVAHQRADRCWCSIENRNAMTLYYFPPSIGFRIIQRSLVHYRGEAVHQRGKYNISVSCDPSYVGGAPVNIIIFGIEHPFLGSIGEHEIAPGAVSNALRFTRRS